MRAISRRGFVKLAGLAAGAVAGGTEAGAQAAKRGDARDGAAPGIATPLYDLAILGHRERLWTYRVRSTGRRLTFAPPEFEVDGRPVRATLVDVRGDGTPAKLRNGATEHGFVGRFADDPGLSLRVRFRVADDSPVVRLRYSLESDRPRKLTKTAGADALVYLGASLADLPSAAEVRLSEFVELTHSYSHVERQLEEKHFRNRVHAIGPILAASDARHSMLVAYEHGAQAPDAFLRYELSPDRAVTLRAVKGGYVSGRVVGPGATYDMLWLDVGAVAGDREKLADAFRTFVLTYQTENLATRRPYVFYNTWNFQERNRWYNGKPYLTSMRDERILREIDVAHRMGIDVFVLDTGWYEKTGDWAVSSTRFPDGLRAVKAKLDGHGMKLGLWFNPTVAAASSRMYAAHEDCVMSWKGARGKPSPVWETEESYPMCLVSRYSDAFAEQLMRLARELGVSYFKWDGVGQYGCDDPNHWHGDATNTAAERADSYAFELVRQMSRVVDRIAAEVPEAIVDFDITEAGRAVGLAFLASGKYFLINNGPYRQNYDLPIDLAKENWNLFFYPGPARTWICRGALGYDAWLPSVLFLTHFFPDDPVASQEVNVASLVLGGNGIWGDLPAVSDAGVAYIGSTLARYKQVRDEITASASVRTGPVGGSPEIYEKISEATGRGAVVVFATAAGQYTYVTERAVDRRFHAPEGTTVRVDADGRARIDLDFARPGARIVFFGVG